MDYLVFDQTDLPVADGVRVWEGQFPFQANVSMIFVDVPPGSGPRLHRHPYQELFIVHQGQARFTVGFVSIEVDSGQIVMVAAGVPHKFVNSGEGPLRQTDIHLSGEFKTEWLE